MTPRFDLSHSNANPRCTKCGRLGAVQRHHRGCEAMWVRHFAVTRATQPKYVEFAARYLEYRAEDCIPLCGKCHKAIHEVYYKTICRFMSKIHWGPCALWTWPQANSLMKKLRGMCDQWLKPEPPK